jgi:hypothetical protein
MENIEEFVFQKLGKGLVENPFLSIMVLNKRYDIVWHNKRFAEEMNAGSSAVGKKCFFLLGSSKPHDDCPLMKSIKEGVNTKGFLDSDDKNFLFFTIPLGDEYAAKVHIFLPKTPDNRIEAKE